MKVPYFDWTDYTVLVLMLVVSVLIGIYFGFYKKKENTVDEYILGGKKMKCIPVALSLVASATSGISLIGVPAEVYTEDPTYWITVPTTFIACWVANYMFLPIFLELNVTSVYEYLELRFDRSIRLLTSAFFNLSNLLYLPTVIYAPSLCLSQVTGLNIHIISVGITAVCVFYTLIGGLKAVIWTDFIQTLITLIAYVFIIIIGTYQVGGIGTLLRISYQDGKMNIFDMDLTPFKRSSFWTVVIGTIFTYSICIGTGQTNVQRLKSLKNTKEAPMTLFLFCIGISLITTMGIYGGLLIYVSYYGCDPIQNKMVDQADQIFVLYVLDKIGHVPTLPGFFIAGVFSAALSTLSTGLNTIAGTIYEDYIKKPGNENRAQFIMKCIVFAVGAFSILFVFLIERMGKILSASFIITSVTYAPVCVLFFLGIMIPWANSKGAIAGAMSTCILLAWISIGASLSKVNFVSKNIYPVDTCDYIVTTTESHMNSTTIYQTEIHDNIFILYKLSYMMYMILGLIVGATVGIGVSFITGATDISKIDPMLISPPLRRFLPLNKSLEKGLKQKLMINVEMKIMK